MYNDCVICDTTGGVYLCEQLTLFDTDMEMTRIMSLLMTWFPEHDAYITVNYQYFVQ